MTTVTEAGGAGAATMNSEVVCKLRALRPAGKPERDPGRTELATTDQERRCRRPPRAHGPPLENETNRHGRPHARPRYEVHHMATITKLRNKIERVSALNGWRMRWHMQ